MADDLGTAVLRITVDDQAARESLRLLRQDVQRSSRVGGAGGRVQGGARDSIRALEQAQERRFRLSQRIERLESQGVNVSRLRARLGEQTTAQAQREFERSRRISVELSRQVRLAEARLQRERQLDTVLTRQARIGGARESVRGRVGLPGSPADLAFLARQGGARLPIRGGVDIPGSPAFLAAELSRSARLGGARSPVGGSLTIPGSPAFLQAALARSVQLGGARSPIGGAAGIPGSPAAIRAEERLAAARQRAAQAAERASQAEGRRIGRLNISPIRGGAAFPGSPDFLRGALPPLPPGYFSEQRRRLDAAARRRSDITSNALIGGAFPLLFGQGIGASLGGAAGGAGGGAIGGQFGFGLSLIGTAVGAQFDAIIQKSALLGSALSNPIARFGELQQAGLLSSKGLERQVESLINVGREAEAAALIQQDLAASYGGAEAAKRLADEQDRLNRSWTEFSVNLGQFALTPIADAATDAASTLRGLNEVLRLLARIPLPGDPTGGAGRVVGGILNPAAGVLGGLGAAARFLFPPRTPAAGDSTTAQTAQSEAKRTTLLSAQFRLITAQSQGYKKLALEAENQVSLAREVVDLENLRARKAAQPEINARTAEGARERFRIAEDLRTLERDSAREASERQRKANEEQQKAAEEAARRASTLRLISSETEIQAGAIQRQLQNAQTLAQVESGILRDTLAQRQAVEETTASALDRERTLRAELGEAQALGDETAVARITGQLTLAAGQTRLSLVQGAQALGDAGRSLRDNIQTAQRGIRSTLEGSFDLLQAPIQQQLLEQARGRINFSLFDVGRVRTPSEIFGAAAASESIAEQSANINQSNTALVSVNTSLVQVVQQLAQKNWNVAVNVQGASGAQIIGDVVGATA